MQADWSQGEETEHEGNKKNKWAKYALLMMVSSALTWYATKNGLVDNMADGMRSSMQVLGVVPSILKEEDPTDVREEDQLRLSNRLYPNHYDLKVNVSLPEPTEMDATYQDIVFTGEVTIYIDVVHSSTSITLNSVNHTFHPYPWITINEKRADVTGIKINNDTERVTFSLSQTIHPGDKVALKLGFEGLLTNCLNGFYQSHYKENMISKIVASTQFSPIAARRMIPCFDEPTMKASWNVTVIHPKGTNALSNGLENPTTFVDENFVMTKFAETPKMSSYLLAIVISDFAYIEGKTASGLRFRIYARKQHANHLKWALECGIKTIDFYEKIFNISFPLPKLDMVAIPDFVFGAMENWGLLTFRESYLIFNPATDSLEQKTLSAEGIIHELAHQWFGNLVTPDWWGNIWLKEGLASYFEFHAGDQLFPNLKQYDLLIFQDQDWTFTVDRYANSHPMSFLPETKNNIAEGFSTITYRKSAMVFHMIKTLTTEHNFLDGLRNYLKRHSYDTATPEDLFHALDEANPLGLLNSGGLGVRTFGKQWTTQMGFPYLTVIKTEKGYKVTQQRYKVLEEIEEQAKYKNPEYGYKWSVPIIYIDSAGKQGIEWHYPNQSSILIPTTADLILLNYGSNCLYRTNYDEQLWKGHIQTLKTDINNYDYRDRKVLISDAFAMANIKKLGYNTVFELMGTIAKDTNYFSVTAMLKEVRIIIDNFRDSKERQTFKSYLSVLLADLKKTVSMEYIIESKNNENLMYENMFHSTVLQFFYDLDDEIIMSQMSDLYSEKCADRRISECKSVPRSLRTAVYCAGSKLTNLKRKPMTLRDGKYYKSFMQITYEVDKLFDQYWAEQDSKESEMILEGIACSENAWPKIQNTLNEALHGHKIRPQNADAPFISAAKNEEGKKNLLKFFLNNWGPILAKFHDKLSLFRHVINAVVSTIDTRAQLQRYRRFLDKTPITKSIHAFEAGYEIALYRVKWIETHKEKILRIAKEGLQEK